MITRTRPQQNSSMARSVAQIRLPGLHQGQRHVRLNAKRFNALSAGRRWRKALALDTPLPTPTGWTTVGDVKVGDDLYDEQGRMCKVIYLTEVFDDRDCYELKFNDGTKIVADAGHWWVTWTQQDRRRRKTFDPLYKGGYPKTTEELYQSQKLQGGVNHSIQNALPVQGRSDSLPIPPYVLGAWLGDGSTDDALLWSDDPEIVEEIRKEGEPINKIKQPFGYRMWNGKRGCITGLKARLRALGVLGHKYIPMAYLRASALDRLSLLQGLMDTDGHMRPSSCEYTSISRELAGGVLELTRSLGIRSTLSEGKAVLNGRYICPRYEVRFSTDLPVFRLPRKLAKQLKSVVLRKRTVDHRFITSILPHPTVPVKCIGVDSPSHLFLCSESFIPTHNTSLCLCISVEEAVRGNKIIWGAPVYDQVRIGFLEAKRAVGRVGIPNLTHKEITFPQTGGSILFRSLDNPDNIRGHTADGVVIDESASVNPEAWHQVLRPMLMDTMGWAWLIGTPLGGGNWFEREWNLFQDQEDGAAWQVPTLGCTIDPITGILLRTPHYLENPNIPWTELQQLYKQLPLDLFRQEIMAEFLKGGGTVFQNIDPCLLVDVVGDPAKHIGHHKVAGVDWGQKSDYTAISVICQTCKMELALERWSRMEWEYLVKQVATTYRRWGCYDMVVEYNSSGAPNFEALRKMQVSVRAFTTTGTTKGPLIQNLRACFEHVSFLWLNVPYATSELRAYTSKVNPQTSHVQYMAPKGEHDDCMPAGTAITTPDGVKPIECVEVGDLVLTHNGRYRPVLATKQGYNDTLYKIEARGRPPFYVTANHAFVAHRRGLNTRDRTNTLTHGEMEWVAVSDGKQLTNYATAGPYPLETNDVEYIDLLETAPPTYTEEGGMMVARTYGGTRLNPKQNPTPRYIPVDGDFCMLLGYYFAEGTRGKHNISFASHEREGGIREWLCGYLRKLGLRPTEMKISDHGYGVSAGSMLFREWFHQKMGKSDAKRFPGWVSTLPRWKQEQILMGYFLGDAYMGGAAGHIVAAGISQSGMTQIYHMALRVGLRACLQSRKGQNGHKRQWVVLVNGRAAQEFISEIPSALMSGKLRGMVERKNDQTGVRFQNDRLLGKIRRVTPIAHNGSVFNLEVSEDNSYVANGTAVHNSIIARALAIYACTTPASIRFS